MRLLLAATLALIVTGASFSFAQAQSNNRIVPGQRVGLIRLGMNTAEVYKILGEPKVSTGHTDGHFSYQWPGLFIEIDNDAVETVRVSSGSYALADGLAVGASEMALNAKRPPPTFTMAESPGRNRYCYSDGLLVFTSEGKVNQINVNAPRCGATGHLICYHYEGQVAHIGKCRQN